MVHQALFQEIETHLLEDEKPSIWLKAISFQTEMEKYPFSLLLKQKETPQSPLHHPEGSVWNHTMMVVDEAAKRKGKSINPRVFMWAALLHDIGKPSATKVRKDKITAYHHDQIGADLTEKFLSQFQQSSAFIDAVTALVRWHMQILYVLHHSRFQATEEMIQAVNVSELALLGLCDRLGRGNRDTKTEEENIARFLQIIQKHSSY